MIALQEEDRESPFFGFTEAHLQKIETVLF